MSINHLIIQGNIGNDPDVQVDKNNREFVLLRVAQSDYLKTIDGSCKKQTSWFSVFLVGKLAISGAKMLRKGDIVCIEGKLRQIETKTGDRTESKLVINVTHFEMVYRPIKQTDSELSEQIDVEFNNYNK